MEIIILGDFEDKIFSNIKKTIRSLTSRNILIIDNTYNLNDFSKVIIILGLGVTSKNIYLRVCRKASSEEKEILSNIAVDNITLSRNQKDDLEVFIVNTKKFVYKLKKFLQTKVEEFSLKDYKNRMKFYLELVKKNLDQKDKISIIQMKKIKFLSTKLLIIYLIGGNLFFNRETASVEKIPPPPQNIFEIFQMIDFTFLELGIS